MVLIIHKINTEKNIYILSNTRYRYSVLDKPASNTRYSAKFGTRFSPKIKLNVFKWCLEKLICTHMGSTQCTIGVYDYPSSFNSSLSLDVIWTPACKSSHLFTQVTCELKRSHLYGVAIHEHVKLPNSVLNNFRTREQLEIALDICPGRILGSSELLVSCK